MDGSEVRQSPAGVPDTAAAALGPSLTTVIMMLGARTGVQS